LSWHEVLRTILSGFFIGVGFCAASWILNKVLK
jgi:hypothetical protein